MFKFQVGEVIEKYKGSNEGVRFEFTDIGADLIILFKNPNDKEIKGIKKGKLQFNLFVRENIIFLVSKFGEIPWMDAPFHVALAKNLTKLEDIQEGQGYGCTITLIDSNTGEIKAIRYVSFNTRFSKVLKENIEEQIKEDFDKVEYNIKLNDMFSKYDTKYMAKNSEVGCRIK